MPKSNTRKLVFGLSVVLVLVLLAILSVGVARFPSPALAQRDKSKASSPEQQDKSQRGLENMARKRQEIEGRVPTIDYDAPEPASPEEKQKRKNRNKHYDGKHLVEPNPYSSTSGVTVDSEVFFDLPALPVSQSDVILTADVLNSEGHLSNNKNAVYSEFNVQVDAVLKGTVPTLSRTNLISVSRLGGMVRYPSGQKVFYQIAHQNMPALGKRYLFFLKVTDAPQAYEIVTAYEIGAERIQPLDYGGQFEDFRGTDEVVFLNKVRDAIANKN